MIKGLGRKGFTLVEIMIVVAIIGLLVAIALPNFMIARKKSQIKASQASMKQIEGAIEQALLDDVVFAAVDLAGIQAELVPNYLKVWPNTPGTLAVEGGLSNNTITTTIDGINGGDPFNAYETITP